MLSGFCFLESRKHVVLLGVGCAAESHVLGKAQSFRTKNHQMEKKYAMFHAAFMSACGNTLEHSLRLVDM